MARTLVPWLMVAIGVGMDRYAYQVQARPSLLPTMLGVHRAHLAALLRAGRSDVWGAVHHLEYVGAAFLLLLHRTLPFAACLLAGASVWIVMMVLSTLLFGPLHAAVLGARLHRALTAPFTKLRDNALRGWLELWRGAATKRGAWLVGVSELTAMPLQVALRDPSRRSVWVLGGSDRRSNATPLLLAVRSEIMAGRGVVFIDSMASSATAAQLEAFCVEAGRGDAFTALATGTTGHDAKLWSGLYQRRAVVFVGLPLQRQENEVRDQARRMLTSLHEACKSLSPAHPWVVAIQDATELPDGIMPLVALPALHTYLAQQRCDAAALRPLLPALLTSDVLILTPSRAADAPVLADALLSKVSQRDRKARRNALVARLRALRWRQGLWVHHGIIAAHGLHLDTLPKAGERARRNDTASTSRQEAGLPKPPRRNATATQGMGRPTPTAPAPATAVLSISSSMVIDAQLAAGIELEPALELGQAWEEDVGPSTKPI